MLKYLYAKEVFSEIPLEITLGVAISGCKIHCEGCHSQELWEDKGTKLSIANVTQLLEKHKGVSCLLLMGGEHDIETLTGIFMYFHRIIRTAWYCGLDEIPLSKNDTSKNGICQYLDYLKLGHYDKNLGGLDSPTTNQRLYLLEHRGDGSYWKSDITHLLQKQINKNDN